MAAAENHFKSDLDIDRQLDGNILGVNTTVIRSAKADAVSPNTLQRQAMELEDEFAGMYFNPTTEQGSVLQPPYNFRRLRKFTQENNSLLQAITAMEVNIDGTGWSINRMEGHNLRTPDKTDVIANTLDNFFSEPWPMVSFTSIRRQLRRDMEETGNAYLEILRNPSDEVVFINRIDPVTLRMVQLDAATEVEKEVMRGGVKRRMRVAERQRRYVQVVGTHTVYFKKYGVIRDLNKKTGKWQAQGARLPAEDRATEVIHFTVVKDTDTPYGVPRWINNLPSVLGSRRAEELNLNYFDAGGIPPVVVFIEGGTIREDVRRQLETIFSKGASESLRAAIVEVYSSEGKLDGGGSPVNVNVERFGSGDAADSDAQFQRYDERTAMRIRTSFRLPPLFLGMTEDYSFATAFASYTVAEAQVFGPERHEFDEIINVTLVRALVGDAAEEYKFRSLPLQVTDAATQLRAVEIASNKNVISGEDLVEALNEITNTSLKFTEMELVVGPSSDTGVGVAGPLQDPTPNANPGGTPGRNQVQQGARYWRKKGVVGAEELTGLALKYLNAAQERQKGDNPDWAVTVYADIDSLGPTQKDQFNAMVRLLTVPDAPENDPDFDALITEAVGCVGADHVDPS